MTIQTNFAAIVAPFITPENAAEYAAQTDKSLWIEYNILDEVGLRATDLRIDWIEDQLEALIN